MRGRSVGVGFAWASAGRLTLQASNLVALMITSRFITPLEFGLFAPVVILASLIYAASEGAFATALMQRVELTDDHVRVSFWASAITAVVMMAVFVVAAPLIERGFGFHGLAPVIAVASLMLPARLISAVPTALMQRQMRFRELASVTLFAAIVGKIIPTVILAIRGFGEWALLVGFVTQTALETLILLYLARPSMGWPSDWRCARDILSFGGRFTIIQSVNQVAQNIDNVLVGRLLGPVALGFYSRVFALMMLPVNLIGSSAQQVLFPRFSRLQEDRVALRTEMHLALDLVTGLILPLSALLAIVTDSLVLLALVRALDDGRVDERARLFLVVGLKNEDAPEHAHLVRGQPNPASVLHQPHHPLDELLEVLVERLDLLRFEAKDRIRVLPDLREREPAPRFCLRVELVGLDLAFF